MRVYSAYVGDERIEHAEPDALERLVKQRHETNARDVVNLRRANEHLQDEAKRLRARIEDLEAELSKLRSAPRPRGAQPE